MTPASNKRKIFVYTHSQNPDAPLLMGHLQVPIVRGKEVFSFEYDSKYLDSDWAFQMDPDLQLYKGLQYLPADQSNYGIFLDSSPDRWGRLLMDRREAVKAEKENRSSKRFMESDYLLGVYDESRMGALRFKTDPEGPFLDNDHQHATPPLTSLRELEQASLVLEDDKNVDQEKYIRNLALLVAPGSSLGGARPKATVKDPDGALWIAKFPSRKDTIDQGAWEYITYQLAIECGIEMSYSEASPYYSDRHTFLTKRFDRDKEGNRIHFFSAMTLLGYQDGTDSSAGVSYLELAELLMQRGARVNKDLEQLWRRIVFNICVSNTDDHLRNHGFILTKRGLQLSPAYDINPIPNSYGLNLNIDEQSNTLDTDLARKVAPYFRLSDNRAREIITEIETTIKQWKSLAELLDISNREIDELKPAFK